MNGDSPRPRLGHFRWPAVTLGVVALILLVDRVTPPAPARRAAPASPTTAATTSPAAPATAAPATAAPATAASEPAAVGADERRPSSAVSPVFSDEEIQAARQQFLQDAGAIAVDEHVDSSSDELP